MVPWARRRAPIRKMDWLEPPRARALAPTQVMVRGWGRGPSGAAGEPPAGSASGAAVSGGVLTVRCGLISTFVPILGARAQAPRRPDRARWRALHLGYRRCGWAP